MSRNKKQNQHQKTVHIQDSAQIEVEATVEEVINTAEEKLIKEKDILLDKTKVSKVGKLSPDGMVGFATLLNELHIKPQTELCVPSLHVVNILSKHLCYIVAAQIEEEAELLGYKADATQIETIKAAAIQLGINEPKFLPSAEEGKVQVLLDEKSIPQPIIEEIQKEVAEAKKEIDLNPKIPRTPEEVKNALIHIMLPKTNKEKKNEDPLSQIGNATAWLRSYNMLQTPPEGQSAIMGIKVVDWFNQMVLMLGDDAPMILKGAVEGLWDRYCNEVTILPAHALGKKMFPKSPNVEIKDIVELIINQKTESVSPLLSNDTEALEKLVNVEMEKLRNSGMETSKLFKAVKVLLKHSPSYEEISKELQEVTELYAGVRLFAATHEESEYADGEPLPHDSGVSASVKNPKEKKENKAKRYLQSLFG